MHGSAQPDPLLPEEAALADAHKFDERELEAALQLLVERAQYITGATGATLALPQGDEMVCHASVGVCAPPAGARLQVRSGLTGESIARRQLLRCDNAESDPRVNLETCREMGIASIVVMPLMRRNGEIRGVFELFSDHPYAFEERDLSALERMADLTLTALDLAESRPEKDFKEGVPRVPVLERLAAGASPVHPTAPPVPLPNISESIQRVPEIVQGKAVPVEEPVSVPERASEPPIVPEAMRRVQKCSSCGFPVSEGRTICLDCEKKQDSTLPSSEPLRVEFVPAFLNSSPPPKQSWLADHVNLLAILVLIVGILVAIVVFR